VKLTKSEIEEAVVTIYTRLIEGQTDVEIADEMGLSQDQYQNLKRAMFEVKAEEARTKPLEHVYIEYIIEQAQNIKALTEIISKFEETKQYTAIVGAIRTRADLTKAMLQTGQEFGIIHKEPDRKEIIAGVAITELTHEKLKTLVLGELNKFNKIYKDFSDVDFTQTEKPKQLYFEGPGTKEGKVTVEGEAVEIKKEKQKNKPVEEKKKKRTKAKDINVLEPEKKKKKSEPVSPLDSIKDLFDD
jgi:hypothetical protein